MLCSIYRQQAAPWALHFLGYFRSGLYMCTGRSGDCLLPSRQYYVCTWHIQASALQASQPSSALAQQQPQQEELTPLMKALKQKSEENREVRSRITWRYQSDNLSAIGCELLALNALCTPLPVCAWYRQMTRKGLRVGNAGTTVTTSLSKVFICTLS